MADARIPTSSFAQADSSGAVRVQVLAVVSGVLGVLLAILTPLLPVRQDRTTLEWPQAQSVQVTAPLVDYVPLSLDLSVPCTALRGLASGTVVSTVPAQAPGGGEKGLVARIEEKGAAGRTLSVTLRNIPLLSAPIAEITGAAGGSEQPSGDGTPPTGAPSPGGAPPTGAPAPSGAPPSGAPSPGGAHPSGAPSPGGQPPSGAPLPGGTPPSGAALPGGTPPSGAALPGGTPPSGAPLPGGTPPSGTPLPGGTPPSGAPLPGSAPPAGAPLPPDGTQPGVENPGGADPGQTTALGNGVGPKVDPHSEPARGCAALVVRSTADSTTAELTGITRSDGSAYRTTVGKDVRPQVVGVFSDLDRSTLGAARLRAEVDSRFSSSPSGVKLAAMAGAVVLTLLSLCCLHRLDTADGRRARRFLPARWWRFTLADAVVGGILVVWHVIGANTSDDGYILTMARVSEHAGYTANYYRWFGVAEAPFGWPYEVLAQMTRLSDASAWMRLPALLAGLLCWWVISREVLPRLGSRVHASTSAQWTAGLVFLAIWLPYNNGLRPEPLIAVGALLTWCSIERAIATRRLLPAAVAVLIAAFSLAAGPSGLICLAALFAGSRQVLQVLITRAGARKPLGYSALLAPVAAAGTLVLVVVFADHTVATVLEATRVRKLIGPDLAWYEETTRWESLLSLTPDGSLARRFGILGMLLCLGVCVLVTLRKGGRIPYTARGPVARVLAVVFMSLLLMMFTPTKWTHHFGVYAGLAGALAAVTAVAVSGKAIRAGYHRSLFAAAVLFLVAFSFTGSNGWWYVSGYGMRWPDRSPELAGAGISTIFLGLAALCLLVAVWQYFREPYASTRNGSGTRPFDRFTGVSLTLAAAALVLFEVASLAVAAYSQYPAYSVALSNLRALRGDTCAMADDVLVETNTADSLLQPYTGSAADGLAAENTGFTANGVGDLAPDGGPGAGGGGGKTDGAPGGQGGDDKKSGPPPGGAPGGGPEAKSGINGSTVALPFGLDPARTPVLGSYTKDEKKPATLRSQWYRLDLAAAQQDSAYRVLILTAAGRIAATDDSGRSIEGQQLRVEFARRADDGTVTALGDLIPPNVGGAPTWRNLPIPLDRIPAGTTAIRLVAKVEDPSDKQWLAVTPPRLPRLATLNSVVGSTDPVLTDFHVGLAFPCQHPFDHKDGVAELPVWRIQPDKLNGQVAQTWEGDSGGGPVGWSGLLVKPQTIPAYLDSDWTRDWGELQRLTPYVDAPAATLGVTVENRWGWAKDEPIRAK